MKQYFEKTSNKSFRSLSLFNNNNVYNNNNNNHYAITAAKKTNRNMKLSFVIPELR